MSSPDHAPDPCLNCGTRITGRFCSACGQKVPRPNPTLREFLHDVTEELIHWDGKIPSSLIVLFTVPGQLTRDFLQGRRARWLPPLRLYLICSIAYFASVPMMEAITHRQAKAAIRFGLTTNAPAQMTAEDRAEVDSSVFTRVIGKERLDRILANPVEVQNSFARSFPKAMFVLLPLFAWLTSLAYRKTVPHYPAHLYFALHEHAAAFGALTVSKLATLAGSTTVDVVAGFSALIYIGWHGLRAARVVFGGSAGGTMAKAVAVGLAYWVFFIIVTAALIAYTFTTI